MRLKTVDLDEVTRDVYVNHCESREAPGWNNSGLPGVICHVENSEMQNIPERCDTCCRFDSDGKAHNALIAFLQKKKSEALK